MQNQPYMKYVSTLGFDFDAILARHKALFGDARMEGEGGDLGVPPAGPDAVPGATTATPDLGFPAETQVKDMTPDQQAAYWKHQSRKHEERSKAFDGLTPEALQALREKADQHDALERELMSDKDKAVLEAKEAAKAEARSEFANELVTAKFEAAAAGRIEAEKLAKILAPLDLTKFLDKSGKVDAEKVAAYVDDVAPKASGPAQRGPSATGLGKPPHATGEKGAQGRAMAEKRFGKTASTGA